MSTRKQAGILITGNEVLSAKTKDTNGPCLGMHLRKIGIPVRASMVCGDDETDLLDCLSYLSKQCDVIFMTGGLGPTSDDLTAQIVARFFGQKIMFFPEAWENCLQAYAKLNRTFIPESNKKQAYLPEHSVILKNSVGTAVGFKVTGDCLGKVVTVYCLPGVPFEMEPMFLNEVYPDLLNHSLPVIVKTWQVFAMGESAMQSAIHDAETQLKIMSPSCAVSYQAHPGFVTYAVSLFPENLSQQKQYQLFLDSHFTPAVTQSFHKHIIYDTDAKIAPYLIQALAHKNCSVFFVEGSCGGALSKEICSQKGAHVVFQGACVLNVFPPNLNDCYVKAKQENFGNATVCVMETGAPSLDGEGADFLHGQFKMGLSIEKAKIKNSQELEQRLLNFEWTLEAKPQDEGRVYYEKNFKVSTRYAKDVQQSYVAFACLCSIASLLNHLG